LPKIQFAFWVNGLARRRAHGYKPVLVDIAERDKDMRKTLLYGTVAAVTGFAILLATLWWVGGDPAYLLGKGTGIDQAALEQDLPDEPHPIDTLLPDPAKLTADWQPFETIDLLRPQETPPGTQEVSQPSPPVRAPGEPSREVIAPAAVIRSADEAECFRWMPYATTEPLRLMPYADEAIASESGQADNEEQEDERGEGAADPQVIQERLNRILQSFLKNGKWPGESSLDSMEFRPSDAKNGEFDRIPF
jgi:hypothetical protein